MPKYDYTCLTCDETTEVEKTMELSGHEEFCEKCGYALIRTYSVPGVSFKGGGFYSTGNK